MCKRRTHFLLMISKKTVAWHSFHFLFLQISLSFHQSFLNAWACPPVCLFFHEPKHTFSHSLFLFSSRAPAVRGIMLVRSMSCAPDQLRPGGTSACMRQLICLHQSSLRRVPDLLKMAWSSPECEEWTLRPSPKVLCLQVTKHTDQVFRGLLSTDTEQRTRVIWRRQTTLGDTKIEKIGREHSMYRFTYKKL